MKQYKDRVAFYVVYIQEAHSSDVWQMPSNIRDKVIFQTPQSFDERTRGCHKLCLEAWDQDSCNCRRHE